MSKVHSIRFGVGAVGDPRSSVWMACVNKKGDVYAFCRNLAKVLKLSFHDGKSYYGFTSKFVRDRVAEGTWGSNKRFVPAGIWPEPRETAPGVVLLHRITVPHSALRPFADDANYKPSKPIVWVPPPPVGGAVEFLFAITKPGTVVSNCPGYSSGSRVLDTALLPRGDTFWVLHHSIGPSPALDAVILNGKRAALRSFDTMDLIGRNFSLTEPDLRMHLFGKADDESRFIIEIAWDPSDLSLQP